MQKLISKFLKKHNLSKRSIFVVDLFLMAISFLFVSSMWLYPKVSIAMFSVVMMQLVLIISPVYFVVFLITGSHRGVIRHSSAYDVNKLLLAVSIAMMLELGISAVLRAAQGPDSWIIPSSLVIFHAVITLSTLLACRMVIRALYRYYVPAKKGPKAALIFGAGELGHITVEMINKNDYSDIDIVGFIDDNPQLKGKRLLGKPIYSEEEALGKVVHARNVREVIFAVSHDKIDAQRKKEFFDRCLHHRLHIREVPPVNDWIGRSLSQEQIREVKIEDLLGREHIWLDQARVTKELAGCTVLVTGAAGSIGSELVRQLMRFSCSRLVLVDQAESPLHDLREQLAASHPTTELQFVLATITDERRMRTVFERYKPCHVFNAAAYKHVPLMEESPYEAIRNNVAGTKLLADLAAEYGVKKFVMISTDKAVNPSNVMGASKRICEQYVQSLSQSKQTSTQFITTRFGNVLGSNGSVVPLFRRQISMGGPVTVTHPDIIRYFMTIAEACQLVLDACFMGEGGEIYVFDMGKPMKIYDLAVKMITLAGFIPNEDIKIEVTGLRPGEKLYEELLASKERSLPTHHSKIKIAKSRSYSFAKVETAVTGLIKAIETESDKEIVARMKKMVPEFKSQNSKFCIYDEQNVVTSVCPLSES